VSKKVWEGMNDYLLCESEKVWWENDSCILKGYIVFEGGVVELIHHLPLLHVWRITIFFLSKKCK
jgi:hypothetical protein